MKILITGATGMVGGEVLRQCLDNPTVSKVVAFVRRELPAEVSKNRKLDVVLMRDFSRWSDEVLQPHSDAAAMVWAMGTYRGSVTADLEYPLAFMESMQRTLETNPGKSQFRCINLGGMFTCYNQDEVLYWMKKNRKFKGLVEFKALKHAEANPTTWRSLVIKPGGIVTHRWIFPGAVVAILGENWGVRLEVLGAYMMYLAVDGGDEGPLIDNMRISRKGTELWAARS